MSSAIRSDAAGEVLGRDVNMSVNQPRHDDEVVAANNCMWAHLGRHMGSIPDGHDFSTINCDSSIPDNPTVTVHRDDEMSFNQEIYRPQ